MSTLLNAVTQAASLKRAGLEGTVNVNISSKSKELSGTYTLAEADKLLSSHGYRALMTQVWKQGYTLSCTFQVCCRLTPAHFGPNGQITLPAGDTPCKVTVHIACRKTNRRTA
ncbi:MAG: hypothetical protein WAX89_06640 [Alphaproteobacteria bacterium]